MATPSRFQATAGRRRARPKPRRPARNSVTAPDSGTAAKLKKKYKSVAEKVAKEHLKMARKYDKAGRTDMSRWHYEKVILFLPDDEEAQHALNHKPVA